MCRDDTNTALPVCSNGANLRALSPTSRFVRRRELDCHTLDLSVGCESNRGVCGQVARSVLYRYRGLLQWQTNPTPPRKPFPPRKAVEPCTALAKHFHLTFIRG